MGRRLFWPPANHRLRYTDPQLLDVLGAIESLPDLIPHPDDAAQEEKIAACGNGSPLSQGLAPMLAPTLGDSGQFQTSPDKTAGDADGAGSPTGDDVSGAGVKQKHPLPCADSGCDLVDLRGFEPLTSALRMRSG